MYTSNHLSFLLQILNLVLLPSVHNYCCCLIAKLCLTLCDPTYHSPPGSSVHGISQARILKWVAISYSRGSSWPKDQICVSCIGRWILTSEPPGKPKITLAESVTIFSLPNPRNIILLLSYFFPSFSQLNTWLHRPPSHLNMISQSQLLSLKSSLTVSLKSNSSASTAFLPPDR